MHSRRPCTGDIPLTGQPRQTGREHCKWCMLFLHRLARSAQCMVWKFICLILWSLLLGSMSVKLTSKEKINKQTISWNGTDPSQMASMIVTMKEKSLVYKVSVRHWSMNLSGIPYVYTLSYVLFLHLCLLIVLLFLHLCPHIVLIFLHLCLNIVLLFLHVCLHIVLLFLHLCLHIVPGVKFNPGGRLSREYPKLQSLF